MLFIVYCAPYAYHSLRSVRYRTYAGSTVSSLHSNNSSVARAPGSVELGGHGLTRRNRDKLALLTVDRRVHDDICNVMPRVKLDFTPLGYNKHSIRHCCHANTATTPYPASAYLSRFGSRCHGSSLSRERAGGAFLRLSIIFIPQSKPALIVLSHSNFWSVELRVKIKY